MSYVDFENSPIILSMKTKPITNLGFPTVTVCPPRGSKTLKNFDLMRAKNFSFSSDDRITLLDAVDQSFDRFSPHLAYVFLMEAISNKENIESLYNLAQSFPMPCGETCFKLSLWGSEGQIFAPRSDVGYFRGQTSDKEIQITLDPARNLSQSVEKWILIIDLELEAGHMSYRKGHKYTLHTERKSWVDSEAKCNEMGGHLPSFSTEQEYNGIQEVLGSNRLMWLGGTNLGKNDTWQWSDSTNWTITEKFDAHTLQRTNSCLLSRSYGFSMSWTEDILAAPCEFHLPFVCQNNKKRTTNKTMQLEYHSSKHSTSPLHLWYRYKTTNKLQNDASLAPFSLKWRTEATKYKMEVNSSRIGESLYLPGWGHPYNESWYKADFVFKANLVLNDEVLEWIENKTLTILLDVKTHKAEGWVESVKYWWNGKNMTEVKGTQLITLKPSRPLTETCFHVEYEYQRSTRDLLEAWENKRMTGFNLSWFVDSENALETFDTGSQLSWEDPVPNSVPQSYEHQALDRAMKFAKYFRRQGMSVDALLERVIAIKIVDTDFLDYPDRLQSREQLFSGVPDKSFNQNLTLMKDRVMNNHIHKGSFEEDETSEEDLIAGFNIFSALVYSPDPKHIQHLKDYKLIYNKVRMQPLTNIVQTLLNFADETFYKSEFDQLYGNFSDMLELQYRNLQRYFQMKTTKDVDFVGK